MPNFRLERSTTHLEAKNLRSQRRLRFKILDALDNMPDTVFTNTSDKDLTDETQKIRDELSISTKTFAQYLDNFINDVDADETNGIETTPQRQRLYDRAKTLSQLLASKKQNKVEAALRAIKDSVQTSIDGLELEQD